MKPFASSTWNLLTVPRTGTRLLLLAGLLAGGGCGEGGDADRGNWSGDGGESGDSGSEGGEEGDCSGTWEQESSGAWVEPGACLAWSPLSESEMDWYTAEDSGSGYCATLELDGGPWRLPSLDELSAAALDDPPLEPLDVWLWSADEDANMDDMAWQVNLDRPKSAMAAGMSQPASVRCVASR